MKWFRGKRGDGSMSMAGFLDYCAELGLEAAEPTAYFFPESVSSSEINALKRQAHLLGLDLSSGAIGNSFADAPGSEAAAAQMEYVRTWIDRYADLGVPVIRVFAERNRPEGASDEDVIRHVIANLSIALEYAEKRGVMLGLENHDLTQNVDYLLRIVRAIESDWLGVVLDSANFNAVPDPYAEMARMAPYAATCQVKVMTKVNGEKVPADYGRIMDILRGAHYRGYVVFEYEEPEDPYLAIPHHLAALRAVI